MADVHMSKPKRSRLATVKTLIVIGSGKGGVGKSTTAVHLALAWQQAGLRVGVLDADIYGPNQPLMLGAPSGVTPTGEGERLDPIERHGLATMSVGYLVDANTPMVLRGPMISRLMEQMLFQTAWPDLDYLIVDLPPGTGDIQLSLAKKVEIDAAVIVTTPQDVALLDARKAVAMFHKVDVPVLGVIENMSTYTCTQCGHQAAIFGEAGGQLLADTLSVPLLGRLPLSLSIREACDQGQPLTAADSSDHDEAAAMYRTIAQTISGLLRANSVKFPNIVVE